VTPAAFRQECANAWDFRDRPKFELAVRIFTDPDLKAMTREQLEDRRNLLHVQLAAVNDQLQRHVHLRAGQIRADFDRGRAAEGGSLDSSPD
jgi:hypothetical protein